MSLAKQLLVFMSLEDEKAFSVSLKASFPAVVVLDDNIWPTAEPVTVSSIEQCKSGYAHLWNRDLFPELPISPRPDGRFQGPSVGPVVQFVRCVLERNVLRSGRIALGLSREDLTPSIDNYLKELWRFIKKPATSKLVCVNPETGEIINQAVWGYWAWPDAVTWSRAEKGRFLRDRATRNFYLPN